MKRSLPRLAVVLLVACGTPSNQQTGTTTPTTTTKTAASTQEKTAAVRASTAMNKLSRLSAIQTRLNGPGRDFTVTDPDTVTLPETACGEDAASGTVNGDVQSTKEANAQTAADTVTLRFRLSLTFKKCVAEGTTYDSAAFVQGLDLTAKNKGTETAPDFDATLETYYDGKIVATGADAGTWEFEDFSMKVGPIALELLDDSSADGAARDSTTYEVTLNGSFTDNGEKFTFTNETIQLTAEELDETLPDAPSEEEMTGGMAR